MKFAQLDSANAFARRIDEHDNIVWDDTHFCKANQLTAEEALQFKVVPVAQTNLPQYDAVLQGIREAAPVETDGVWTQAWEVYPLPLADQQANQRSIILTGIRNLEAQVTGRRLREALVTGDSTFIVGIELQIDVLRAQII
jgi:hypothetical protein